MYCLQVRTQNLKGRARHGSHLVSYCKDLSLQRPHPKIELDLRGGLFEIDLTWGPCDLRYDEKGYDKKGGRNWEKQGYGRAMFAVGKTKDGIAVHMATKITVKLRLEHYFI